jgi:hypothetical protein
MSYSQVIYRQFLRRDRFQWISFGKGYRLLVKDSAITCVPHDNGYYIFLVEKAGKTSVLIQKAVPLETAMAAAENYACKTVKSFFFDQGAKWRKEKASDKQLQLLDNLCLPYDPVISKGDAANLLNQHFNQLATEKKVWYLNSYNLHPFPEVLSKKEAGRSFKNPKTDRRCKGKFFFHRIHSRSADGIVKSCIRYNRTSTKSLAIIELFVIAQSIART